MHLRRALLLFAIVLGVAAVAASLAPPPEERSREDGAPARLESAERPRAETPAGGHVVRFKTSGTARSRSVPARRRVSVVVETGEPGQAEIAQLRLVQAVDRSAPAVFDLYLEQEGRLAVAFRPVEGRARRVGAIDVTKAP